MASQAYSSTRGTDQAGFTLIEIIVVVVVVAVLFSMMTLSLPSGSADRMASREAQRLLELLRLAREEAVIQSSLVGFSHRDDGYGFHYFDAGRWTAPDPGGPFRERSLPDGLVLELLIDGASQDARPGLSGAGEEDEERPAAPELMFWPDGQIQGFELSVGPEGSKAGARYRVIGTPDGSLQLKEPTRAD